MSSEATAAVSAVRGINSGVFRVLFWLAECESNGLVRTDDLLMCRRCEISDATLLKHLAAIRKLPGVDYCYSGTTQIHALIDWGKLQRAQS